MTNIYQVPTQILADQAKKTAELYRQDNAENKAALSGIGLGPVKFDDIDTIADQISRFEGVQESAAAQAQTEQLEATEAMQAIISWRSQKVIPRARIAFGDDKRLRHYRPGQLRSVRAATVVREGKLLVDAIRRFADTPEALARGLNSALADEGAALIDVAETEDLQAAAAHMHQLDNTEALYELEDQLDDKLAEIERCAKAVFPEESAARKRYRLNEIRNYIAVMHDQGTDDTAEVNTPDPAPDAAPQAE
jgi:hypothetical protein